MSTGPHISRRETARLLGGAAAFCLTGTTARADDVTSRFRKLLDDSAGAREKLVPFAAARVDLAFVDPFTDAYARQVASAAARDMTELDSIQRHALSPVDRIAYDVLRYQTVRIQNDSKSGAADTALHAPLDSSFGLHVEYPDFITSRAKFGSAADYELHLRGISAFAAYFDTVIERLRQGLARGQVQPRLIAAKVLVQVDAMLATRLEQNPLYAPITRMPADMSETDRARFAKAYRDAIEQIVLPAYGRLKSFLTETYLPRTGEAPGRWAMQGGPQLYLAELERHVTLQLDPNDVHARGLAEVARARKQMEAARKKIGFKGDLNGLFEFIRTDPRFYCKTPQELIDRMTANATRIWQKIPTQFARQPRSPFQVGPLPGVGGAQRGTGYYRPGSATDGTMPGTLYFNMDMLSTRPIPTLETLTLHEGIPGHHFQINLARENEKLPALLRGLSEIKFTAFTEGWGLYAESLGRDLGMFDDPYQWSGHLDMGMLRNVRLVVDTGIHAKQWDRARAIAYMLDNTSMAQKDVEVEIDRYIASPGQACGYKMGELKIRELRDAAARKFGKRFDIRQFHDQVLGTGALPLQVLGDKLTSWIASGGGGADSGF